jgi:hypothetical protein
MQGARKVGKTPSSTALLPLTLTFVIDPKLNPAGSIFEQPGGRESTQLELFSRNLFWLVTILPLFDESVSRFGVS